MPADKTLIKARLPRGFADRIAAEIRATEAMVATIRSVYERYGFEPVETPFLEYTEALGKFLPDQDRPNEGVFSLQDDDEQWTSLRYDLTAPLARYFAENHKDLPRPYRSYRFGWVFRNEKPGPGRFRQFMQFDADTVGAASPAADAEICMMAADTLEALGIPRGQYLIKVNSRKVLDGVMEAIGVTEDHQKLTVLRAIDKLDRLGIAGVRQLLGPGRWDGGVEGEGDFTRGAGLGEAAIETVLGILDTDTESEDTIASIDLNLARSATGQAGREELEYIALMIEAAGYDDRVVIDPSVVRGLEYYTGPVFEAELLAEIPNEKGQPVVFGSVGGGGRYDGLVGRFMKEEVPATGFSIGVSRLQAALAALGRIDTRTAAGPVVVTVMDHERLGDYQKLVTLLRNADIAAELYLGATRNLGKQLKYADRRNAPAAIIQGDDEKARGVVQVKDLALGKALAEGISDHEAWKTERPGQFEVAVDGLVDAIRRIVDEG
ncbi:MAG: histidine--tRNA ligase [Bauldia sp.]|uniref:histidine--tRNA ligase n=1 Tax=Bauldia sp. TaxID=2575872 RepID=UPI001E068640|nr:histidine--tRNA ligase [Bauldia sp.]MCB1494790.1 histidine--tRNA ligase [Bauldia sp.]